MLPNLIVIGAMKCGTTSLHHYLDQHPEIEMAGPEAPQSPAKELHFFDDDQWRERIDWYASRFGDDGRVRGEATPNYTAFPSVPGVPERIHELIPKVKLIYLVGDPLKRIAAHWVHWHFTEADRNPEAVNARMAARPLAEALTDYENPRNPFVCRSRYATQLERYLRLFPLSQILVLDQEDLRRRRVETLQETYAFLGVDDSFGSEDFGSELNTGDQRVRPLGPYSRFRRRALALGAERIPTRIRAPVGRTLRRLFSRPVARPSIDTSTQPGLTALLTEEADRLRELTGKPFADWSV